MSTDGPPRPDRISDGSESDSKDSTETNAFQSSDYVTGRGANKAYTARVANEESPNASSLLGIEKYHKEPVLEGIDARTRRSFSLYSLLLLGLFVSGGLIALVALAMTGSPSEPTEKFLAGLETPFFSVVSLIAGFFFGRAGRS